MVVSAGRGGAGVPGRDPRDVRPVERGVSVEREPARPPRVRAGERTRDDHLRRRPAPPALREAGGKAEAGRAEERVRRFDAVVDDPDLDALAARSRAFV
jgi:hypothetical protein